MKVAILAGGLGTRMREETEFKPKPMVEVGGKPILWHIMKNFAHFGMNDFVVLAGYKVQEIKRYFSNFLVSNHDFTVSLGEPQSIRYHGVKSESNWTVTVVDTGLNTPTGGRIARARRYLDGATFVCTYGDGLASVNVKELLEFHKKQRGLATVTVTRPSSRFGIVETVDSRVRSFREKPQGDSLVSVGYFVFEPQIFNFLSEDVMLEAGPMEELASQGQLSAFEHSGFWQPLDTYREYQAFNALWTDGSAPWKTWPDD